MRELSHKQQEYLIRSLSKGELTERQALQFAARNKVIKSAEYHRTLVGTTLFAALAYVVVGASGGVLAGAVVLAMGLESYLKQRSSVRSKLRLIDDGDYREHFEDEPDILAELDRYKSLPAGPNESDADRSVQQAIDVSAPPATTLSVPEPASIPEPSSSSTTEAIDRLAAPATPASPNNSTNASHTPPNEANRSVPQTKEQLIHRLKTHEGGWVWDLIDQSPRADGQLFRVLLPIMLVAAAGSYKSYLASSIALLRVLLSRHSAQIIDPHGHKNRRKAWAALLATGTPIYGSGNDYRSVGKQIDEFINTRCKSAGDDETPRFTPIWDEMTNYDGNVDGGDLLLRMVASDARKLGECPIVITHADTNTGTGGTKGLQATIARGFIRIRLDVDDRNGCPNFTGLIEYPADSRGRIFKREISFDPSWLHPDVILQLLAPHLMPRLALIKAGEKADVEVDTEITYQLEKSLRLDIDEPENSSQLPNLSNEGKTAVDRIEQAILEVLMKVYPDGMTLSKLQGQRQILKGQTASDLREFVEVLVSEEKIHQSGAIYTYRADC